RGRAGVALGPRGEGRGPRPARDAPARGEPHAVSLAVAGPLGVPRRPRLLDGLALRRRRRAARHRRGEQESEHEGEPERSHAEECTPVTEDARRRPRCYAPPADERPAAAKYTAQALELGGEAARPTSRAMSTAR